MSQTENSEVLCRLESFVNCSVFLPSCLFPVMDMQIESQVTQVVYPRQNSSKNWLTALSISFYLLLRLQHCIGVGFCEKLPPLCLLGYQMITTEGMVRTEPITTALVKTGLLM